MEMVCHWQRPTDVAIWLLSMGVVSFFGEGLVAAWRATEESQGWSKWSSLAVVSPDSTS